MEKPARSVETLSYNILANFNEDINIPPTKALYLQTWIC
jgi:hypothetical protein